jgi:hypothetical protein
MRVAVVCKRRGRGVEEAWKEAWEMSPRSTVVSCRSIEMGEETRCEGEGW